MSFRDELNAISQSQGRTPEKWEIDARLSVCRACEHFTEHDHGPDPIAEGRTKEGQPTCSKCKSCMTKIVRFMSRRWRCPLGRWTGWSRPKGGVGGVPWEALWRLHEGKTFLVIGRGPSRDQTDLGAIERDVTIATNLSLWEPDKQRATRIDYDIVTDEDPCRQLRPSGVKLLSNANTDGGRQARQGLCWCVFPHHKYGWGPIARGAKLPTAWNSGIAAVSMAFYMGAKHVKVVGIDYRKTPSGAMHSNDLTDEAKRKFVGQYQKTFKRVSRAAQLQAQWAAEHAVAIENLAANGRIRWEVSRCHQRVGAGQAPPASKGAASSAPTVRITTGGAKHFKAEMEQALGEAVLQTRPPWRARVRATDLHGQKLDGLNEAIRFMAGCVSVPHARNADVHLSINGRGRQEAGAKIRALWGADDPHWVDRLVRIGRRAFDIVFTPERNTLARHKPGRTHYLPLGASPTRFYPRAVPDEYQSDVLWLGCVFPERKSFLEALAARLTGCKMLIIGNRRFKGGLTVPPSVRVVPRRVSPDEASKYYAGAKIVICAPRAAGPESYHARNRRNVPDSKAGTRVFQATMCGAFILTPARQGMIEAFPGGEYATYLRWNAAECALQVKHWLADPALRDDLALRACAWSRGHHTWYNRLQTILTVCRGMLEQS